ncbi:MAG: peptidase M20 [Planctomycetota bacterium]|nr:MAG: peptidase M20 [Planctomycetota bacterium]
MSAVIDLLRELVAIPSVSGNEEVCRDAVADWLNARGLDAQRHGRNVLAVLEGRRPGRGLVLCSHYDVVPVGPGWTENPWSGELRDGKVLGRGSNDAKSSIAAMMVAAERVVSRGFDGRLVLALVCDEETGGEGIEAIAHELPEAHAAVVGEPTGLDVCPGQRGLFRAKLVAHGRACHASRPWEGENALQIAAQDVVAVHALPLGGEDPLLGPPTLQATVIAGGTRSNVIPGEVSVELDGRPTPGCDNEVMEAKLRAAVQSDVLVSSSRFTPVHTPDDHEIVQRALAASITGKLRGFGGVSDLFHLRHLPGVVMGPGTSKASHAPDEWVAVDQVEAAVEAYASIADGFLNASATTAPTNNKEASA